MVFHFDPGLGRLVQKRQRQVRTVLQHRQQASFDLPPERFLFPILIGRIRQRRVMNDAETFESLPGFCSDHGRTVIGQK